MATVEYEGLFKNIYQIIGWKGKCLQTKKQGYVFTLTRQDTDMLLKSLGLKESDIPGSAPIPPTWTFLQ